jgi:hypothetical protein
VSDYPKATTNFLSMLPSDKSVIMHAWYAQATAHDQSLFDTACDLFMKHKHGMDVLLSAITAQMSLRSIQ